MKKRILSTLLALGLCAGLAVPALAAEEDCDPVIIGGNRGERPPTDIYNDHIDTLEEAAEKGYVLTFSEGEGGPIDLGSVPFGASQPLSKTITVTNEGDKSLYLVTTGHYAVEVTINAEEYKKQSNPNFNVPVYELEPGHSYHLNITAPSNMNVQTHQAFFTLDFSYTYPANHSAMKAWDLSCKIDVTYTVTADGISDPITVSRDSLDFQGVEPGSTQEQTITVTNISSHEVELWDDLSDYNLVHINGSTSLDMALAPGERTDLILSVKPYSSSDIYSYDETFTLRWQYKENGAWVSKDIVIPIHIQVKEPINDINPVFLRLESPCGPSGYFTSLDGQTIHWGNERFDVPYGESLSFKAVPFNKEYGYILAVEKCLGKSEGDGFDYVGYDDTVTFENVTATQYIKVSFATCAVPPSGWAREAVGRAYSLGIFFPYYIPGGNGENGADGEVPTSSYADSATRGTFCQMAHNLYNKVTPYRENPFSSANSAGLTLPTFTDDNNHSYIQEMAYLGVVGGVGNGLFDPDGQLTREQAATILARLSGVLGVELPKAEPTFADSGSISSWAKEAVGQMQASGIMGGVGDNRFDPQGAYSWEQSIATLIRLYDHTK